MSSELGYIQIGVEAALAGLVWWLFCRDEALRGRLAAVETAQNLTQEKLAAAVGDLHQRLQQAEKRGQSPPARGEPDAPQIAEAVRRRRAASSRADTLGLSRGERDLLVKVKELGQR